MVAPSPVEMAGKEMTELQHSKEFVKEEGTAIVRQTRMVKRDLDVSGRSEHSRRSLT